MFTLLNWLTNLPDGVGLTLFVVLTIVCLLLPWGVARWRDHHGALPRRRRASLWVSLLGAGGAFVGAFLLTGICVASLLWAWVHSDNFHGQTDDMAAGIFLSLVVPSSCLVSAAICRAIRWKRGEPVVDWAPPADPVAALDGSPASPVGNREPPEGRRL